MRVTFLVCEVHFVKMLCQPTAQCDTFSTCYIVVCLHTEHWDIWDVCHVLCVSVCLSVCSRFVRCLSCSCCDAASSSASSPFPAVDEFVTSVVRLLGSKGTGAIWRWAYFSRSCLLIYDIIHNRWCANVQREHRSNNIMSVITRFTLCRTQAPSSSGIDIQGQ